MAQDPELKEIAKRETKPEYEAMAKWIKAKTGVEVDVNSLTVGLRLYSRFRKSDEYEAAREARRSEREGAKAEVAQRRNERRQARADKLREQLAALESGETPAPVARGTAKAKEVAKAKSPAKPRARASKPKDDDNVTDLAPRRGRRGRPAPTADVAADGDDEF